MRTVLALALLALGVPAGAQESIVIYRCTAANGAVLVQNDQPCPAGMTEQRRVMSAPAPAVERSARAPTRRAARRAPPDAAAASARTAAATLATGTVAGGVPAPTASAPVPVASTTGSAGESGTGGTAGPTTVTPTGPETTSAAAVTRRAPPPLYQCSSADGTTAFSPDPGPVGRCTPVAESALCDGWRARMAELDAQTRASDANLRTSAQNELERVTVAYNASTCVVPAGVIPAS